MGFIEKRPVTMQEEQAIVAKFQVRALKAITRLKCAREHFGHIWVGDGFYKCPECNEILSFREIEKAE
jgi:hypothetical protein